MKRLVAIVVCTAAAGIAATTGAAAAWLTDRLLTVDAGTLLDQPDGLRLLTVDDVLATPTRFAIVDHLPRLDGGTWS